MKVTQQLADEIKRCVVFLMEHRGRCFDGWPASQLYKFCAYHWLNGTLFASCAPDGAFRLVVIAWLENAARIIARAAAGTPHFTWEQLPKDGDSILIADVVGERSLLPDVRRQVNGAWPDSPRKRLFAFRKGRLVELAWPTIDRLTA